MTATGHAAADALQVPDAGPRTSSVGRSRRCGSDGSCADGPWSGCGASCEEGASLVTSVVGVAIFLTFLLVTVQVVLYLFTASVVQAAAVDGASHGAGAAQAASEHAARDHAAAVLGRLADDAVITTGVRSDVSGEVLTVAIAVRLPSALGTIGLSTVEREAAARIEQ